MDAGHLVEDLHLQAGLDLRGVSGRQFAGQRQRPAGRKLKERLAGLLAFGAVHRDHLRGQRRQEDHVRQRHAARRRRGVAQMPVVLRHRVLGRRAEEPGRVAALVVPERGKSLLQFRHVGAALTGRYVPPCGDVAGQCEQRLAVYLGELLAGRADVDSYYREVVMQEKLALDLQYIEQRSMILDLKILFRTVLAVFR